MRSFAIEDVENWRDIPDDHAVRPHELAQGSAWATLLEHPSLDHTKPEVLGERTGLSLVVLRPA